MSAGLLFRTTVISILLLSLCGSLYAEEQVLVGVYDNPPLVVYSEEGVSGLSIDVLEEIARHEDFTLKYIGGSWSECLSRLEKGQIDLLVSIGYSEQRDRRFAFTQENLLANWARIYTQEDAAIQTVLDLEGMKVAALKGDIHLVEFNSLVNEFHVKIEMIEVDSYEEIFTRIERGQVDAGVVSRLFGLVNEDRYGVEISPIVFSPIEIRFAVPKDGRKSLISTIDKHLIRLKSDRESMYYRSMEHWLSIGKRFRFPPWMLWLMATLASLILLSAIVVVVLRIRLYRSSRQLSAAKETSRKAVNQRRRVEQESEVNALKYQTLFDTSPNAVFLETFDGDIIDCNSEASRMYGWPKRQLLSMHAADLVPPDVVTIFPKLKEMEKTKGGFSLEAEGVRKDGSRFPTEVNAKLVQIGEEQFLYLYVRDITKQKRDKQERNHFESRVRHQQKLESIGTLASGVAHEINNPINIIMNYAELISDHRDDGKTVVEYSGEIISESKRIASIVRNLLAFSRQDKEAHSPANIGDIIDATMTLVGKMLDKDQIVVSMNIEEELPKIKCRSQQIMQVLMNLVTNARDSLNQRYPGYDPAKRIGVQAGTFTKNGTQWIRCMVEDFGMGMDRQTKERIFDPFFTTKPREKGTGLGLSVSHGIVKDHGGELYVKSRPGEYCRFFMDLPINNGWKMENGKGSEK